MTLVCFLLMALSWGLAGRHAGVLFPTPDPPPPSDPSWKQRAADELLFFSGACAMPVFGILGLFFLYGTFGAPRRDEEDAEPLA